MIFYRVYLDGTLMPKSIDLSQFANQIERGLLTKTSVRKFSGDVRFVEDGAAYIQSLLDVSPCGEVDVLIEGRCEGTAEWRTVATGVVILKDVVIEDNCSISATIDPNNFLDVFTRFSGKKVDMDATRTINGVVVLPSIRKPLRNFFDSDGTLLTNTNGVDYAYGYDIGQSFQHIIKYITDGNLDFVSDFFSTAEVQKSYNIEFATTPVSGEVITFIYTDEFNNTHTLNVTSNGNAVTFIGRVRAAFYTAGGNYDFPYVDGNTSLGLVEFTVAAYASRPELVSVTSSGATVITVTENSDYVDGHKAEYITDGNHLSNKIDKTFYMSFDALFNIMNTAYDLGIAFEYTAGQWYLRIEPKEYFFNNSVTLDLGSISGATIKYDTDRIFQTLALYNQYFPFKNFDSCIGALLRQQDDKVHYFLPDIVAQIDGTDDFEDDIFFIKGKNLGGAYDEPVKYEGTTVANLAGLVFTTEYFYNWAWVNAEVLLKYHVFFLPDAVYVGSSFFTYNINLAGGESSSSTAKPYPYLGNEQQFIKMIEFTKDIGFNDYIDFNEYSIVQFSYKGISYEGYVLNLDRALETGTTEINLLIK